MAPDRRDWMSDVFTLLRYQCYCVGRFADKSQVVVTRESRFEQQDEGLRKLNCARRSDIVHFAGQFGCVVDTDSRTAAHTQ